MSMYVILIASLLFFLLTPGINSHLLLSILVKHLDHKNIVKQPIKQICIVNVTTQLAQNAKLEASVAIIGAITELMKQLRKCMQCSSEASSPSDSSDKWNTDLQSALKKCILQLSNKIHLDKRVPTGAGLGGGSSNVATALWAVNQFSGCLATEKELQEWSSEIGSDVLFFFSHGAAYCTDRGEFPCSLSGIGNLQIQRLLNVREDARCGFWQMLIQLTLLEILLG